MNRYNFVVHFYDTLKRIVFGRALNNAAKNYVNHADRLHRVLIVGGGTGATLPHFSSANSIDYVDASPAMIHKAKKRQTTAHVNFHTQAFQSFNTKIKYDVIHFPFFLDLFNEGESERVLQRATHLLKPDGRLVVADFYPSVSLSNWRQKLVLRTVIVFFIITTRHRYSKIFNIVSTIKRSGYQLVDLKNFANGMVFASIWKRMEH